MIIRNITNPIMNPIIGSIFGAQQQGLAYTPPLDVYPARAAYSTRLLRTAYTGPCMRVRRSSDNAEQDIGFTSAGGLNTAALLAFVGAGNGLVTRWNDQSGNGFNVSNTTAANQPPIVSSGTLRSINGLAAPYTNGTNTNYRLSGNPTTTGSDTSVFVATLIDAAIDGRAQTFWELRNLTTARRDSYSFNKNDAGDLRRSHRMFRQFGTSEEIISNPRMDTDVAMINTIIYNASTVNVWEYSATRQEKVIDGASFTNSAHTASDALFLFNDSNLGDPINGYIGEFIMFDDDKTADQSDIQAAINNYWGAV